MSSEYGSGICFWLYLPLLSGQVPHHLVVCRLPSFCKIENATTDRHESIMVCFTACVDPATLGIYFSRVEPRSVSKRAFVLTPELSSVPCKIEGTSLSTTRVVSTIVQFLLLLSSGHHLVPFRCNRLLVSCWISVARTEQSRRCGLVPTPSR